VRNIGALAFRLEDCPAVPGTPWIRWEEGAVQISADEALDQRKPEEPGAIVAASAWLKDVLADGPVAAAELKELARRAGHSWRTLNPAKAAVHVQSRRTGFGGSGGWIWYLIPEAPQEDKA